MTDPADLRFFQALKRTCDETADVGKGCRAAIDTALETGDPLDLQAARKALETLDDRVKDEVLRKTHLRMASDLSAIWDVLPGASRTLRPN